MELEQANLLSIEMKTHFVMKSWLKAGGNFDMLGKYINPWLTDILKQWVGRKSLKEDNIDNIEAIMSNITRNQDFRRSGDNVQLRIQWVPLTP